MTNIIGQVAGGTISNGQGCYGACLLPDTFKKILLTLAEDRCVSVHPTQCVFFGETFLGVQDDIRCKVKWLELELA